MSVSNKAKSRGKILEEIMAYEREQLPKRKRAIPAADLRALADVAPNVAPYVAPNGISFKEAVSSPGISLIAECKRASPSKGLLVRDYDPAALALIYADAGARAVSVLTNSRYFQGSLEDMQDVKAALGQGSQRSGSAQAAVLRKDFIFDVYQLYEAKAYGADAILLIAAVLEESKLRDLMQQAEGMDMDVLVEVHSTSDLDKALKIEPSILGINNRDLRTFKVDFGNTARLSRLIPDGILLIGESGIKTAEDVKQMAQIGVDAVLVGQSLVQSKDIFASTRTLVNAGL